MPSTYQAISEDSQALIVSYLNICFNRHDSSTTRERYRRIDSAIQLEVESRREKIPHYYDDITMPVIKPPVRKISNFLIDMFASTPSLFEAVSNDPERADAVKQMNAVIEENSKTSNWPREMVLFLKDLPKYNFGGIEVAWEETEILTIGNTKDVAKTTSELASASRSGNVLKRLDVYNTFYDTNVPVNLVTTRGDFIGYNEQLTFTRLHKVIEDLKLTLGITSLMNEAGIFKSPHSSQAGKFYRPTVQGVGSSKISLTPMEELFGASSTSFKSGSNATPIGVSELQTFYARIVPSMFRLKVPSANKVQIWKFTVLNWTTLIVAEKLVNAHGIFPAILCQIDEEGIDDQVKSAAEMLLPLQNLMTKYYDARVKGLRRNLSDRALFDQTRIDKKHLEGDDPSANIPVKPNLLNPSLENAYRAIPFNDNLSSTMLQELNYLDSVAKRTSGLNDPQLGNFQKGNKTLGEFNEVMQNADDDLRTWAKLVEAIAIVPLKYLIKINILQFQLPTSITSGNIDSGTVDINPMDLRKAALEFKMADGLLQKETLIDLASARGFFELLLQSPQLQAHYGEKMPQLVEYIFSSVGFDTAKFRGTTAPAGAAPAAAAPTAAPTA
jgi:hypothetical protein